MRGRAWRRHVQEKIVIKRLRRNASMSSHYYFSDINGRHIQSPILSDYIGSDLCNMYKTYKTSKYDSKYKKKYSQKRKGLFSNKITRVYHKREFLKILKEHGII
jgi:hypothetical protein